MSESLDAAGAGAGALLGLALGALLELALGVVGPRRPGGAYCLPRSEKYTSNTVSKARQWALALMSVAASAYLNASRSSSGMCFTASMASRFSVRLTGSPASRSSRMNPFSSSSSGRR